MPHVAPLAAHLHSCSSIPTCHTKRDGGDMRWMTLSGTFVVLALSTTPVWAQSEATIRGQLIADADGSALSQGSVTLTSKSTGTTTETTVDSMGSFTFPSVGPGEYLLDATADGFAHRNVRLVLQPREVRTIDVGLAVREGGVNFDVRG